MSLNKLDLVKNKVLIFKNYKNYSILFVNSQLS